MEYFKRGKYQTKIISEEYFNKWIDNNPQFKGKIDYQKFKRYWRYLRKEMFNTVLTNPSGMDLPLDLGNLSVKLMDVEFKGPKDYPKTPRLEKGNIIMHRDTSIGSISVPSVVWKKSRKFRDIPSMLGLEKARTFKIQVRNFIKMNGKKSFQKMAGYIEKKSEYKEEEQKPISIFDLIDKNEY